MNFDFSIVLVALAGVTGFIWLIDWLFFAKSRNAANQTVAEGESLTKEPWLTEQAKSFFPVLFIILIVRSFWFEPFKIPSGSMIPTLLVGDFIVVNKFAYGIRLPVINKKIISIGDPKRGDIVIFRRPKRQFHLEIDEANSEQGVQEGLVYIKRLVGLPGDVIRFENNTIFVNGAAITSTQVANYLWDSPSNRQNCSPQLMSEDLLGVTHQTLECDGDINPGEWTIPAGQYFMMGDNRDGSADSRDWGFVPEENLVGRASLIWFHFDFARKGFVAWNRIGTRLK